MSAIPNHKTNHTSTYAERIRNANRLEEQQKQQDQTIRLLREEAFAKDISCTLSRREISQRTTLEKCEEMTRNSLTILSKYYLRTNPRTENLDFSEDCTHEENVNHWLNKDLIRVMQNYQRKHRLLKKF